MEDGLALRRILEAADRSYKVAPEPSRLLLRMKSSAVVFEGFQGFASESPFFNQWCSRKFRIESSHFIYTTWKHFSVVRMNFCCDVSALRHQRA